MSVLYALAISDANCIGWFSEDSVTVALTLITMLIITLFIERRKK
jgi:hypothetical protein